MWGKYFDATCGCGIQIHHLNTVFYYDTCGVRSSTTTKTFFFRDSAGKIYPLNIRDLPTILKGRDTDDNWWNTPGNAFTISNIRIQLARSRLANTFVVRNTLNFISYDRAHEPSL
jgi:hypothetical protein